MRGDSSSAPGNRGSSIDGGVIFAGPTTQRRLIVILFADLSDSTAIAAGMEPEQYAELLEQLRAIVRHIIPAHGGDIVRIDGDGALCIFGHPQMFEDAGRRAAEAALDLHAAMQTLDGAFAGPGQHIRLHIGIHAGLVLLREGDLVRGKVEIIGDATNVAARLCDAARPGDTLVSPETLGSDEAFFRYDPGPDVAAAGRRRPIQSWRLLGRSDIAHRYAGRTRHGLTPLVGRTVEQQQFDAWLAKPASSPILLAHGAAGLGKSRFASACADRAAFAGWNVARGYCEAYLGARPLQPFLQIAGGDPASIDTSIAAMLAQRSDATGTLLIIDDWQWSDDASRDLLARLISLYPSSTFRILLASREAESGMPPHAQTQLLSIPPLGRDESLTIIELLLGSPDPFAIEQIEQAAGGSPLLIEELCHAHAAGTAPFTDLRKAWFDIAIQTRFSRLDLADRELLRLAAAIGHTIPIWLYYALRPEVADAAVMGRLQGSDFLYAGDTPETVRFKHGLTRDALYAGLGRSERVRLHSEILTALEARAEAGDEANLRDALAYHSAAAGETDKARVHAIAAGDAALALGALDRAQAHYSACFALADSIADTVERLRFLRSVTNRFGTACIVDPAADQIELLCAARQRLWEAGDAAGTVRGDYWLGAISYGMGMGKRSIRYLQSARTGAKALEQSAMAVQIELKLAQSFVAAGRYAEAAAAFEQVLPSLSQNSADKDWEVLAYGFSCNGFMLADQGDFVGSDARYAEAHRLIAGRPSPVLASVLTQQAAVALWRGEWSEAMHIADTCLTGSKRSRQRFQTIIALAIKSYAQWQAGGGLRDLEQIEGGARWFMSGGNSRQRSSLIFGCLTDILANTGDRANARRHAAHLVGRVRDGGDRIGEAMGWRALAQMEQKDGTTARADHYLRLAQRSAALRTSRREIAQNQLCEALLMQDRGDRARQRALAAKAATAFAAMGMLWFKTQADALASR